MKNDNLKDFLTDVADAIREKEGSSEPINPQEFSDRIRAIQSGGGDVDPAVPSEYTVLTYIESTGNQYIDTGFIPNQDTRVVAFMSCPVSTATNWAFGCRAASNKNGYGFVASSSGIYQTPYNNTTKSIDTSFNTSNFMTINKDKNKTYLNGVLASEDTYSEFSCPVPLVIFACDTNGTRTYGKCKLSTMKIYDNGVLVRDYVACRNTAGEYGLYDKVNNTFTTSGTAYQFVGGEAQTSNGNLHGYTGHADVEGLKAIGWDDADIEYFKQHGIKWNAEQDDLYKVSDDNKALYGVMDATNIQDYKNRIVYLPKIDLTGLKSITALFKECVNMIGLPIIDTSVFTAATNLFHTCRSLTYIPPIDTSKMTAMGNFCYGCYSLTHLPMLNTSKVIDFSGAFFGCYSLTKIPAWDFSSATTTYRTFYNTVSLTDLPDLNLQNLVSGGRTCYDCYCLKNVGTVKLNASATISEFFYLNSALTEIRIEGLASSISFAESPLLSKESLIYMIRYAEESATGVVITLHPYAYERLANDADVLEELNYKLGITLASAE